jgi:hypothetical protein
LTSVVIVEYQRARFMSAARVSVLFERLNNTLFGLPCCEIWVPSQTSPPASTVSALAVGSTSIALQNVSTFVPLGSVRWPLLAPDEGVQTS